MFSLGKRYSEGIFRGPRISVALISCIHVEIVNNNVGLTLNSIEKNKEIRAIICNKKKFVKNMKLKENF